MGTSYTTTTSAGAEPIIIEPLYFGEADIFVTGLRIEDIPKESITLMTNMTNLFRFKFNNT